MMRLARKHSDTGSRTVAGTMLILNFVHLKRFKDGTQGQPQGRSQRLLRNPESPDHARLKLSDGVRAGVLQRNLRCHGEFPSSESDSKSHCLVIEQQRQGESRRLAPALTHRPVCDGFRHEVILSNVLSEGHQPARLVQHVFPHQTRHPRHALYPRHVRGDVGPRVGGAEIHL